MVQHDGAHGYGDWGWVGCCGWVGTHPGGCQKYGVVPPWDQVGHNIGTRLGLRLMVLGLFGDTFDAAVAVEAVVGSVWDWIWKNLHSI